MPRAFDLFRWCATLSLMAASWSSHSQSPAAPLSTTAAIDGDWLCTVHTAGATLPQQHYLSIHHGVLQTDTIDTDMRLSLQSDGHYLGQWLPDDSPPPPAILRQLTPTAADRLHYTDTAAAAVHNQSHPSALGKGACQRLPSPDSTDTPNPSAPWQYVQLAHARPTQAAVGFDQIYAKQARYRDTRAGSDGWKQAFDDWCQISGRQGVVKKTVTPASSLLEPGSFRCKKTEDQMQLQALKTAVIGPGGQLYLTDGHHSLSSLWEAPVRHGDDRHGTAGGALTVPVRIQADYRDLSLASFWRAMRAQGYTWLTQIDGSPLTPATLPTQLGLSQGLQDDPYRSLLYFTRKVGYQAPEEALEFLEFYWAQWLRAAPRHFRLSDYQLDHLGSLDGSDRAYLQAVHDAATLITRAQANAPIAHSGQTAAAMGQLPTVNEAALRQLVQQGQRPGKLAAALHYRAQQQHQQQPPSMPEQPPALR